MELIYLLIGVVLLNFLSIFVFKKKLIIQIVLITSIIVLFLFVPNYLVKYGIIEENIINSYFLNS